MAQLIKDYALKLIRNKSNNKPVDPSVVAKEMEKLCPNIHKYYPHFNDMAIFFAGIVPMMEPDVFKLANLAIFGIWICLFDDGIEIKGPEAATQLIQVMKGETEPSGSTYERIWVEVIKAFFESIEDANVRAELFDDTLIIIESMANEHQMDVSKISMEEYMAFRKVNISGKYLIFCIEYGLGTTFQTDGEHSEKVKEFKNVFLDWLNIVQDIYSMKKETLDKDPVNYIKVLMRTSNLNFNESITKAFEEVDHLERKLKNHLDELLFSNVISMTHCDGVANFMVMFVKFHKYANRYNSK